MEARITNYYVEIVEGSPLQSLESSMHRDNRGAFAPGLGCAFFKTLCSYFERRLSFIIGIQAVILLLAIHA